MSKKQIVLTEKGSIVLKAMQDNKIDSIESAEFSKGIAEIAFMLPSSVPGVMLSLGRLGLVEKTEDSPKKYFLTESGKNFSL